MRVVWTAIGGTVEGLIEDRDSLAAGRSAGNTNLDAASIEMLLGLDPFVGNPKPVLSGARFVPAEPPNRAGFGASPQGGWISISRQVTGEDKRTTTKVTTKITEFRPGWLTALFGNDQTRQDTVTLGYTSSVSERVDDKVTNTATFFSEGPGDPYNAEMYFDRRQPALAPPVRQDGLIPEF